jgi:hypothetical protein
LFKAVGRMRGTKTMFPGPELTIHASRRIELSLSTTFAATVQDNEILKMRKHPK